MDLTAIKHLVWNATQQLPGSAFNVAIKKWVDDDAIWVASHPMNELQGQQVIADGFYAPLQRALPDLERRTDIFFGGHWDGHIDGGEGWWVTCTGHYLGTFKAPLFGIPCHHEPIWLRFGEFYRVANSKIVEARILLDLVDLARQAGRPLLPPASGKEVLVPGPRFQDGLMLGPTDPGIGHQSMDLVLQMIGGLGRFDRRDLSSMGMSSYWHPDMMWYGPGGIGTTRSIQGFEQHHQRPFLHAIPDRKGGHHRTRLAEGAYVATTGWPSVRATHLGSYLGVPASGRKVEMRVMDWWRAEGGLLAENWVLIDLPHFFRQMDVDLLARAAS